MAKGIQPAKIAQCSWLQTTCSLSYHSVDSNLILMGVVQYLL